MTNNVSEDSDKVEYRYPVRLGVRQNDSLKHTDKDFAVTESETMKHSHSRQDSEQTCSSSRAHGGHSRQESELTLIEHSGQDRLSQLDFDDESDLEVDMGIGADEETYILDTKLTHFLSLKVFSKVRSKVKSVIEILGSRPGIILIVIAQVFGSLMTALTRKLETSTNPPFHPLQILFVRMIVTWTCSIAYMHYTKVPDYLLGPKGYRFWLILRGIAGFFGVFGMYYSLMYLNLSDATVLTFLNPTMVGFLAWLMLGEVFTIVEILGGLVSLIGVIIIARPTFLLGMSSPEQDKEGQVTAAHRVSAVLVSMMGVIASGIALVAIRKVGLKAHPLVSVSIFAFCCCIVSFIGILVVPGNGFILPETWEQVGLLTALGCCGFTSQFMSTAAIQREKAALVAGMNYTSIIWALLWERIFFHNVPDVWSWIGGSIILSSAFYVAIKKIYRVDKAEEPEYQTLEATDSENELDDLRDTIQDIRNEGGPIFKALDV